MDKSCLFYYAKKYDIIYKLLNVVNKNMLKSQLKFIITIVLVLGFSISLQSLIASWQEPSATPPADNIDKPINTGNAYQKKYGSMDIGGNFGVASNLTVLSNITNGGTIYTDNISASTTGLNINSGDYGMEFNIDADGSGGDQFIYKVHGITMMTVSHNGDLLVNNDVYSGGNVLVKNADLVSNYYSKNQVDSNYYNKAVIDSNYYTKTQSNSRYYSKSQTYTKAQVDAKIAAVSGGGGTNDLYLGQHSSTQCTDAGGSVVIISGDKYCKFSGSSCGGGFTPRSNLTKTSAKTCNGTYCYSSSCIEVCDTTKPDSCVTSYHSFAIHTRETCSYKITNVTDTTDEIKDGVYVTTEHCTDSNHTCYANITEIGCY